MAALLAPITTGSGSELEDSIPKKRPASKLSVPATPKTGKVPRTDNSEAAETPDANSSPVATTPKTPKKAKAKAKAKAKSTGESKAKSGIKRPAAKESKPKAEKDVEESQVEEENVEESGGEQQEEEGPEVADQEPSASAGEAATPKEKKVKAKAKAKPASKAKPKSNPKSKAKAKSNPKKELDRERCVGPEDNLYGPYPYRKTNIWAIKLNKKEIIQVGGKYVPFEKSKEAIDIVFNHLKEGKTLGFCKDVAASLKEQLAIQAQEGKFSDAGKADADASPEDAEAAEGAEEEVKEEDPPLEEIQGQDAQDVD